MSLDNRLNELKAKFWEGETSLQEEKELKGLLINSDEDDIGTMYFNFIQDSKMSNVYKGKEVSILQKNAQSNSTFNYRNIAAALLLMISCVFVFNWANSSNKMNTITAQSPEEAIVIIESALTFMNDKIEYNNKNINANLEKNMKVVDVFNELFN